MTTTGKIISIPVANSDGMDSLISGHFARAPLHAIVNTADCSISYLKSREGTSGKARIPFDGFKEKGVSLVLCRQMGRHAFELLTAEGVETLTTKGTTIREIIMELDSGKLEKPTDAILDHEGVLKHRHGHGEDGECCGHSEEGRCCGGHGHGHAHGEGHGCQHRHGHGHKCCHGHE